MDEAKVDRQLRSQWPRSDLREREPFLIVGLGNPLAFLDQVAVHESHERNRSAKAKCAQPQEIKHELPEGVARWFVGLV